MGTKHKRVLVTSRKERGREGEREEGGRTDEAEGNGDEKVGVRIGDAKLERLEQLRELLLRVCEAHLDML